MGAKLRSLLLPYWIQLNNQLQVNSRLRWMLWGIAYILIIYVALTLSEWRLPHTETLERLQKTSAKLEQLKHQTQWSERAEIEKAVAEKLRGKLWESQSESLAEADVQNYLRLLMTGHNVQNYRPKLAPTEKMELGGVPVIVVTAEVSGSIDTTQIDHLMKSLADNPKTIGIERFSYNPQGGGQLTLQIKIYFIVTELPATNQVQAGVANGT